MNNMFSVQDRQNILAYIEYNWRKCSGTMENSH